MDVNATHRTNPVTDTAAVRVTDFGRNGVFRSASEPGRLTAPPTGETVSGTGDLAVGLAACVSLHLLERSKLGACAAGPDISG